MNSLEAIDEKVFSLRDLSDSELSETEGGIAPLLIVGAIYVGSAVAGGLAGYGLYKALDWALN
jgi:lactobin A/cerein 7B family class IIb bacteriocin